MNKHLFLFTITNVQNFIAQARKTQDLFAGSQLLSDLIDCAMKTFQKKNGTIIFPDIDTPMKTNRFLGEIENKSEKLKDIGKDVENAVRDKLKNEAQKLVKEKLEIKNGNNLPAGFNQQIDQLLDIKWAFVTIENDKDYKKAHNKIEKAVAALKNIRSVKQFDYQIENGQKITGERGRKCSVDGERNVKFYRKTEKEHNEEKLLKTKLFIDNKSEVNFVPDSVPLSIISEGEGLSAVSMLKRCYSEQDNPSTADICLLHLKEDEKFKTYSENFEDMFTEEKFLRILINHFQKINLKNFKENFIHDFDSQFCFSENLTEKTIKNPNQLHWVKRFQDKFIQPFIGNSKNRHYALLSFDIDNLGKWLAGDFIKNEKETEDFHEKLAEKLKDFSNENKNTIPNSKGRIIYNGGDDFLALVNLNYLFEIVNDIQAKFDEKVNCLDLTKYFKNPADKITISFGITVAHYKTPLNEVLKNAKLMLEEAKEFHSDKASTGIIYMTHSSIIGKTIFRNTDFQVFELLENAFKEGKINNKFYHVFGRELMPIAGEIPDNTDYDNLIKISRTELLRIMKRGKTKKAQKEIETDIFPPLFEKILLPNTNNEDFSIENFLGFAKIADKLASNLKK